MKLYVPIVFIGFFILWLLSIAFLSGLIQFDWIPLKIKDLVFPESFESLGNAMGTLDGLFSSIAIVLGLIAILFQGRELKASTDAQALQAKALAEQISQQQASNELVACGVRLQFLNAEINYLESKISSMVDDANLSTEAGKSKRADDLWKIIKASRNKLTRYRTEAEKIDRKIQLLLGV